jgi:hypothetical protein
MASKVASRVPLVDYLRGNLPRIVRRLAGLLVALAALTAPAAHRR